jgi:hypothetical protein
VLLAVVMVVTGAAQAVAGNLSPETLVNNTSEEMLAVIAQTQDRQTTQSGKDKP